MYQTTKMIITGGLGGPACCGIILAQFSLSGCECKVSTAGQVGGSVPLRPGQSSDSLYVPVNPNQPLFRPVELQHPKDYLKVTVKFNETSNEKEILVPRNSLVGKFTVKIVKFIERHNSLINVAVKHLKDITNTISVKVTGFKKRDK